MSAPPDRTTARTERLFSRIIVTRPDQCSEAGGTEMSRMWHTSACRVQTNPISGLRKSWGGWTLGSTNVEGELHSPFPVKTKLDKVTQIIKCYAHFHRNLYWLEALHQLMDKEWCSRASSKSLGFFNLAWFQNHTTIGDLF